MWESDGVIVLRILVNVRVGKDTHREALIKDTFTIHRDRRIKGNEIYKNK